MFLSLDKQAGMCYNSNYKYDQQLLMSAAFVLYVNGFCFVCQRLLFCVAAAFVLCGSSFCMLVVI